MEEVRFDKEVLKGRIKERILRKFTNLPHDTRPNHVQSAIKPLIDAHNIMDVQFFSDRKIIGKYIVLTKRVFRKMMSPILMKQINYNQRIIDYLSTVDQRIEDNHNLFIANKVQVEVLTNELADEIVDEMNIQLLSLEEQLIEIKKSNDKLHNDIKTSLLCELAEIEHSIGNDQKSYILLLMALRSRPDDLELEQNVLQAFERLNKESMI